MRWWCWYLPKTIYISTHIFVSGGSIWLQRLHFEVLCTSFRMNSYTTDILKDKPCLKFCRDFSQDNAAFFNNSFLWWLKYLYWLELMRCMLLHKCKMNRVPTCSRIYKITISSWQVWCSKVDELNYIWEGWSHVRSIRRP